LSALFPDDFTGSLILLNNCWIRVLILGISFSVIGPAGNEYAFKLLKEDLFCG